MFFYINFIIKMWSMRYYLSPCYNYYCLQPTSSNNTSEQDKTTPKIQNQKEISTINPPIEVKTPQLDQDAKRLSNNTKLTNFQRKRQQKRQKLSRRRFREDNFQRKPQKKDRNLPSNLLKTFFSLILDPYELQSYMKRLGQLISSLPQTSLVEKLQPRQQLKKNYLSLASVRSLWDKGILSEQQGLLLRMVLKHYLLMHFPLTIIRNTKLRKGQRLDYLKACRRVHEVLLHQRQYQ